jgi:hypothetical protein
VRLGVLAQLMPALDLGALPAPVREERDDCDDDDRRDDDRDDGPHACSSHGPRG